MKALFIEGFKDNLLIPVVEKKQNVRKSKTFFVKEFPTLLRNIATNYYWKKTFLNFGSKMPKKNDFENAAVPSFILNRVVFSVGFLNCYVTTWFNGYVVLWLKFLQPQSWPCQARIA